jgi:hypothetical protein
MIYNFAQSKMPASLVLQCMHRLSAVPPKVGTANQQKCDKKNPICAHATLVYHFYANSKVRIDYPNLRFI